MPARGQSMPAETRAKIAKAMKGRKLPDAHKRATSRGMIRYWARLAEGARSGENWRPRKAD